MSTFSNLMKEKFCEYNELFESLKTPLSSAREELTVKLKLVHLNLNKPENE